MTTPSDGRSERPPGDDVAPPETDPAFDPYRFGAPDVPPPPEFAPPGYRYPAGYVPPATPPQRAAQGPTPYPGPPPAAQPGPWGAPPGPPTPYEAAPWHHPQGLPPGRRGSSGKALTSMILGISSIALCWLSLIDAVVVILALVFGILGLNETRTRNLAGRGQAIAGLVCAAVGAVLSIAVTILVIHAANKCGGLSHQNDPGFRQCVQRNF